MNEQASPGWYPQPDGSRRYWDGSGWTEHVAGGGTGLGDERNLAMLAHILVIVASLIGPLIVYLVAGDRSPFVKRHAAEALDFSLTLLIGYLLAIVTIFVGVGFVLIPALVVVSIVFPVLAAVAAAKGQEYRYPISIPIVRSQVR
jgi:hypothetical protein